MKIIILSLFIACLILSSCAKEHSCNCYDSNGIQDSGGTLKSNKKSNIDEFKSQCEIENDNRTVAGGHCTYQ